MLAEQRIENLQVGDLCKLDIVTLSVMANELAKRVIDSSALRTLPADQQSEQASLRSAIGRIKGALSVVLSEGEVA
jgi:hypothetical protein